MLIKEIIQTDEDGNFPSYADIKQRRNQPMSLPPNPAIKNPDGKVRGLYKDPKNAKQRISNIMYKAGRGLSRLVKGDPDYDPYDQRDAEVQKHTLPISPYNDGSQPPAKTDIPSIFEPVDMEKIRAEIGAEYGLSADDVLKYSKADQPLPSQIDPKLIPKGTKLPTDAQVLAYRKDHPPVFKYDEDNNYGIPDGATLAQLDDIAKNAKSKKKRTRAHYLRNMRRGKNKK